MKAHTSGFKTNIKLLGREIDSKITYTLNNEDIELGNEDLNSVSPHYEGGILKSVMKQLDIDSNVDIPLGTEINYQFGLKVGNSYEYLDFGNYIVYSSEKQEDTRSWKIVAYDKMLYAMKDYEAIKKYVLTTDTTFTQDKSYYEKDGFEYTLYEGATTGNPSTLGLYETDDVYPCTLREYLNSLCNNLGLDFASKDDTFANYDREIDVDKFLDANGSSLGYTYRDVLDQLAEATASTICINNDDELEIRYVNPVGQENEIEGTSIHIENAMQDGILYNGVNNITQTNNDLPFVIDLTYVEDTEGIDEEYLKDINVKFGEKYGPVNSIVLSRSAGADNIYLRDETSVIQNGLCEIKIEDNQLMNDNDRANYLPDLLEVLDGLEYYVNDFSSTGITYYDLCDSYNVSIDGNIYNCIMLNNEINITQGIEELIHTDLLEESETDYTKADKTDRRIRQTNLIVDKQNQTITSLVSEVGKYDDRITTVEQDVGSISSTVKQISDAVRNAKGNSVTLTDCAVGQLQKLSIYGNVNPLRPRINLYPSTTLYPKTGDFFIKQTYTEDNQTKTKLYELPFNYFGYINENIHDVFNIDKDGKCTLTKNVGINNDGTYYELQTPIIEQYDDIIIENYSGTNTYEFLSDYIVNFDVDYVIKNDITDIFATKVEVNSQIKQTKNEISLEVDQKTDGDELISKINLTPGQILLEGTVTANENFKILQDGSIEATNGVFNGTINGGSIIITDNYSEQDPYIAVEDVSEDSSEHPWGTRIWRGGISSYDYRDNNNAVIRTENLSGFAELSGHVVNAYGFNNISLVEKKKNISDFEDGLSLIKNSKIYTYNYKGEKDEEKKHIGLIIGENYKTPSEVVYENGVDTYAMVSVAWQSIKQLNKKIEELENKIKEIRSDK